MSTSKNANLTASLDHMRRDGLVMIIRGQFEPDELLSVATTLVSVGATVMEVTLNTPNALAVIGRIRKELGADILVGAGSVRSAKQWTDAYNAGAQFTVAPNLDMATVSAALAHDVLHLPGVYTATEAETAHVAGCKVLKLFPASFGGPAYMKALRAPLDDLRFVPTGGVSAENAAAYRQAGAFALGIGSAVVKGTMEPLDVLKQRARKLREAWGAGA